MKFSFGILKPDCIERGLVAEIMSILTTNGFKVILTKRFTFTRQIIESVYERAVGREYFGSMCEFLTSGESIAVLVGSDNEDAILKLNSVVGNTDPKLAKAGTVRTHGENVCRNIMHSTADEQTFYDEVKIFFTTEELKEVGCV